jgi:hypothetical protein
VIVEHPISISGSASSASTATALQAIGLGLGLRRLGAEIGAGLDARISFEPAAPLR